MCTASPSATPGARLNDSVIAGNWPWWLTDSVSLVAWYDVNALSGTCTPAGDAVDACVRRCGSTSITT